jgi:hypothetical protein
LSTTFILLFIHFPQRSCYLKCWFCGFLINNFLYTWALPKFLSSTSQQSLSWVFYELETIKSNQLSQIFRDCFINTASDVFFQVNLGCYVKLVDWEKPSNNTFLIKKNCADCGGSCL